MRRPAQARNHLSRVSQLSVPHPRTKPVIPNRCNRKQPFSFSRRIYKLRWRIAGLQAHCNRYDRLARMASVCLAAALVWWI
jgi:hypothetical protein